MLRGRCTGGCVSVLVSVLVSVCECVCDCVCARTIVHACVHKSWCVEGHDAMWTNLSWLDVPERLFK